jgi:hypothetical protein
MFSASQGDLPLVDVRSGDASGFEASKTHDIMLHGDMSFVTVPLLLLSTVVNQNKLITSCQHQRWPSNCPSSRALWLPRTYLIANDIVSFQPVEHSLNNGPLPKPEHR